MEIQRGSLRRANATHATDEDDLVCIQRFDRLAKGDLDTYVNGISNGAQRLVAGWLDVHGVTVDPCTHVYK